MNDPDDKNNELQNHQQTVSVRRLAEHVHRSGGLAMPVYGGLESKDGIKAHQRFTTYLKAQFEETAQFRRNVFVVSELSVQGIYTDQKIDLLLRGRLDNLTLADESLTLYEVKSFQGTGNWLPAEGEPVHWAQLQLYAALLKEQAENQYAATFQAREAEQLAAIEKAKQTAEIRLVIAYVAVDHDAIILKERFFSWQQLREFRDKTCAIYLARVANYIKWRQFRDAAARTARFPFSDLRVGQYEMMRQVLATIRDCEAIFVQAPTGIGKTMGTLFPALKALTAGYVARIFYATAMTSTREVAAQALRALRESGFLVRSLILTAKETSCLQPDLYCDQTLCPYAVDYYQRLPDALTELLALEDLTATEIRQAAIRHQICPFELSLDLAEYCDVIIGDYNHIFDPKVRLVRFFEQPDDRTALLIDEAHNLPSRARGMYSAALPGQLLPDLADLLRQPQHEQSETVRRILNLIDHIAARLLTYRKVFEKQERPTDDHLFTQRENAQWLLDTQFIGVRQVPDLLLAELGRLNYWLKQFLDEQRVFEQRRRILEGWFELLHFARIAEFFFNESYITAIKPGPGALPDIYLLALDAAKPLTDLYFGHHPIVFFSATLSPLPYYMTILNAHVAQMPPEHLILSSPFPAENRLLCSLSQFSVRYRDRDTTLVPILNFVLHACDLKTGNYLVYVPSYQYLAQVRQTLSNDSRQNTVVMFQERKMSEWQKEKFLRRFENYGRETLIAFVVIGSLFNEGIDLIGERLSGVFVIGTGLPQISPEREIMAQYYAERFQGGRAYGYQYPGFNRVQQAVGRLIRGENDRGFAVLIDDRYREHEWRMLFPHDWNVRDFSQNDDLINEIAQFWQDRKSTPEI